MSFVLRHRLGVKPAASGGGGTTFSFVIASGSVVSITGGGITGTWTGPVTKNATSGAGFTATVCGAGGGDGETMQDGLGGGASYVSSSDGTPGTFYIAGAGGGGAVYAEFGIDSFSGESFGSAMGGPGNYDTAGGDGSGYATANCQSITNTTGGGSAGGNSGAETPGGNGGKSVATINTLGTYYCRTGGGGSGLANGADGTISITIT